MESIFQFPDDSKFGEAVSWIDISFSDSLRTDMQDGAGASSFGSLTVLILKESQLFV